MAVVLLKRSLFLFLVLCCVSPVQAGGFDNSGLPFGIIFDSRQQANELRVTSARVMPNIQGNILGTQQSAAESDSIQGLVPDYSDHEWALRVRFSDRITCAMRYETPYRAEVIYPDDALSYRNDDGAEVVAPLESHYNSKSLTSACRLGWQTSTGLWFVIAGVKHQHIEGAFSSDLTSAASGSGDNLEVKLTGGSEFGSIWGLAYEKPEIGARIALFFHSEIDYELSGKSYTPTGINTPRLVSEARSKTRTPKSIAMTWQTGITENWLVFGSFRWSEWRRVDRIEVQDQVGNPELGLYSNNTLDYDVGVVHKVSDSWAAGLSYASGKKLGGSSLPAGVDSDNLRDPQGRRHTLTLGSQYLLAEDLAVDANLSYAMLEEKRIVSSGFDATIKSSDAISLKLGFSWFFH